MTTLSSYIVKIVNGWHYLSNPWQITHLPMTDITCVINDWHYLCNQWLTLSEQSMTNTQKSKTYHTINLSQMTDITCVINDWHYLCNQLRVTLWSISSSSKCNDSSEISESTIPDQNDISKDERNQNDISKDERNQKSRNNNIHNHTSLILSCFHNYFSWSIHMKYTNSKSHYMILKTKQMITHATR